jgi:Cys-rich repeat protein
MVTAPRIASVDVLGFTPCTTDKECPKGQECNEKMQICE